MIINTTKRKNGFTLAEVLITIGIIGIVAAMTLPAVIGNYKKQEVVSRLKKFYVTLNQALLMSVPKTDQWNTGTFRQIRITENRWMPLLISIFSRILQD